MKFDKEQCSNLINPEMISLGIALCVSGRNAGNLILTSGILSKTVLHWLLCGSRRVVWNPDSGFSAVTVLQLSLHNTHCLNNSRIDAIFSEQLYVQSFGSRALVEKLPFVL